MNNRYNKNKAPRRIAFEKLREADELWRRGFNRGARESFRARNNRKISRIAART